MNTEVEKKHKIEKNKSDSNSNKSEMYFKKKNKLREVQEILVTKLIVKQQVPELQGEPEEIARLKVEEAFKQLNEPVMVEDTSLCFNAYGGLPDFLMKLQPEKLAKMGQAFGDNKAYAQTIFSMKTSKDDEPKIFVGRTQGTIVDPRGSRNFGWDCIFQPEGFDKTYGELTSDIKNKISQRSKALAELLKFLKK